MSILSASPVCQYPVSTFWLISCPQKWPTSRLYIVCLHFDDKMVTVCSDGDDDGVFRGSECWTRTVSWYDVRIVTRSRHRLSILLRSSSTRQVMMSQTTLSYRCFGLFVHVSLSAPFFIPSTSFCSLSSWFTSSCAYHLITVTTFALITYHCLYLSLHLFHKYFPP